MRRFVGSPSSDECWGPLAEILPSALRRRLVLFSDAEQSVWVAGGNEDERRDVVQWIHSHGRTHLGRLLELEAAEIGDSVQDWLVLQRVLRGPAETGSDITAVCIHDADRLSVGSLRFLLGALNELESCEAGLGAPRLIATSAVNLGDVGTTSEDLQHLLMRLDVLHFEIPDPLSDLSAPSETPTSRLSRPASAPPPSSVRRAAASPASASTRRR